MKCGQLRDEDAETGMLPWLYLKKVSRVGVIIWSDKGKGRILSVASKQQDSPKGT